MINNAVLIQGVSLTPLKQIGNEKGLVMHHLNYLSPSFMGFQESYISKTYSGVVKAWKLHLEMTQNLCVPFGRFHFVLFDCRENSSTRGNLNHFILDEKDNFSLLTIPPKVYYGFKCICDDFGLIFNVTNILYDPNEVILTDESNEILPVVEWNDL